MIKKLYHKIIIFAAILLVSTINAQNKDKSFVSGKVTSTDGQVIQKVKVSSNSGNIAYTDESGEFTISAKKLTHIVVESSGYATRIIPVDDKSVKLEIKLDKNEAFMGKENLVNIPFGKLEKGRLVGSVATIDVEQHLKEDQRIGIGAAISGKVGGVFNNADILGLGGAVYVVDGIPRDPSFVNLTEIEEITVLKDAVSRVLYGSAADRGVVLITTKRGKPFQRNFKVRSEFGRLSARELPEYLNAADYMQAFNQANINDGKPIQYSQTDIDATRAGTNPLLYPDNDLYSSTFLKDAINYVDVNLEASGGTDKANYFLNIGVSNREGWINLGQNEQTNRVNIRANSDYKLSDKLRASFDVVGVFDFFSSPDVFQINNLGNGGDNLFDVTGDFWTSIQNTLPTVPLLIPIADIADPASYANANLVDGQFLLAGTNEFQRNIYGDLLQSGRKDINSRYLQLNTGLDWDLSTVAEGLTATADFTFDLFNRTVEVQNRDYAVYQPVFLQDINGVDSLSVTKIGLDVPSNSRSVVADEATFSRRFGGFGTLNYKKDWSDSKLDVTALLYVDQLSLPSVFVEQRSLNYGIRANYMYKNKYLAEFGGLFVGSRKFPTDKNTAFSPTFGLGWIISKEDYLKNNKNINYLKLRGTIGLLQNDNFEQNFLHETYYSRGGFFNYSNTTGNNGIRNAELNIDNIGVNVGFQKRLEYNLGFEGLFFDNKLYLEGSYFYSKSFDLITNLNNSTPNLLGYTITANNNAFVDQGVEFNLKYKRNLSKDVNLTLSASTIYATATVDQLDEPIYPADSQSRVRTGRSANAIFGYTADGLYGVSDFDTNGDLVSGLPTPVFGAVQPGDIKYIDINNDGVIDVDDQSVIGNNAPTLQYSLSFNLEYKNFEFFMLGIGQNGDTNIRSGSYFRTSGTDKYPAHTLQAYGPNNQNVNALYPRLSSNFNNNNFRTSTFWTYENNFFTIPTMQLSYNYEPKAGSTIKSFRFFVKGNNLVVLNKNKEFSDLRFGVGSSPLTKGFSLGLVSSF